MFMSFLSSGVSSACYWLIVRYSIIILYRITPNKHYHNTVIYELVDPHQRSQTESEPAFHHLPLQQTSHRLQRQAQRRLSDEEAR